MSLDAHQEEKPKPRATRPADNIVGRQTPHSANIGRLEPEAESAARQTDLTEVRELRKESSLGFRVKWF